MQAIIRRHLCAVTVGLGVGRFALSLYGGTHGLNMVFNRVEKTGDAGDARRLRSELPARSFVPMVPLLTRVKGTHTEKDEQTGTRIIITLSAGKGGLLEV